MRQIASINPYKITHIPQGQTISERRTQVITAQALSSVCQLYGQCVILFCVMLHPVFLCAVCESFLWVE
jgi:hypothetical protein